MIPRRALITGGPLALAACSRADESYFGRTDPPQTQRLVHLLQSTYDKSLQGIVTAGGVGPYLDPSFFLEQFISGSNGSGSDWIDRNFDALLLGAAATADPARRFQKLAECDRRLLGAMPIIPLTTMVWTSLAKPYVKGLGSKFPRPAAVQIRLDRHQLEAIMTRYISRRSLFTAGPLAFAACKKAHGAYFGKTDPPTSQRLVYLIGSEPETLDPGKITGGYGSFIVESLFEGLTNFHPTTAQPMAALATHYEVNADVTQYTFYLRGHSSPRGMKLLNTDTLRDEYRSGKLNQDFSRGHKLPPDTVPAHWSDGTVITAEDFVYSWRRVVDPKTATPQYGYFLYYVRNGQKINESKLPPDRLAVRALDEFTFQIDLRAPTPHFLQLTSRSILAPVPRRAIEAAKLRNAEPSWTDSRHMLSSGAFTLREHRPNEKIVVAKNPRYYEAGLVALDEITFIPISDAATGLNLYKTGDVHAMSGDRLPPLFTSAVQRKKDAYTAPAFFHIHPVFNTTKPPFNNVLLRYALNMAIDKAEIARMFGEGRTPGKTHVPPFPGYTSPSRLMIPIDGRNYDVLSCDPAAARGLLAKAGYPDGIASDGKRLSFEYRVPQLPHALPIAEVLQQQWRRNLDIRMRPVVQEFKAYVTTLFSGQFEMAENGGGADYGDPNTFLDLFETGGSLSIAWKDAAYDALLHEANSMVDSVTRMKALSACEAYLLRAMPVIPLLFYGFAGFQKPYVRGLSTNVLDVHPFKYVCINTDWKPEC